MSADVLFRKGLVLSPISTEAVDMIVGEDKLVMHVLFGKVKGLSQIATKSVVDSSEDNLVMGVLFGT